MKFSDIITNIAKPDAPWLKYYKKEDRKLKVLPLSIYGYLIEKSIDHRNATAYNYFGKTVNFTNFIKSIDKAASAFLNMGIKKGDVITVCMPNTPEAVISFYAINKIGAIANMIHPLSGETEIKHYLNSTNSKMLIMIDICYDKVKNIINETKVKKTIVVSANNSMPFLLSIGYVVTQGRKINKPTSDDNYIYWKDFIANASDNNVDIKIDPKDPAVILHSGGTTGNPKGIVLSNYNFNALVEQAVISFHDVKVGDSVLTIMPIFHGFGLGVSIHCPLCIGASVTLMPQFNAKKFDQVVRKYRPNILFGVPTLYESMSNSKGNYDLSYIKHFVSGGDTVSNKSIEKINNYLADHNCKARLVQGYGLTESLAATTISLWLPKDKDGSVGIPLVENYYKIVKPHTQEKVPSGENGEICISGPTVMIGYLNNEKETNESLQYHKDGRIWLHTGDIGAMDKDGVIWYKQRLKRMIVSNGYNIYPSQVETIIEEHDAVLNCTVIGIPHKYKSEVAKAYIVLKNNYKPSLTTKKSIKDYCIKNMAAYAIPYEFEFRKSLPKTMIGKTDFKKLQEENNNLNGENNEER